MGKLKVFLVSLLALGLLIVFACFPDIVAAHQDWQNMHGPLFDDIQSVRLDIQSSVPVLGRLAMMCKLDLVIEIPEDLASLTSTEVEALAYEAITPYVEAGMADPFDKDSVEFRVINPRLAQVPDMPELSGIFWDVVISADSTAFYEFHLTIDDETGKALLVNFSSNYVIGAEKYLDFMEAYWEIYFGGLGIENYGRFETADLAGEYVGDNAMAVRYRFGDAEYGEINVDFYVYQHGFYVELH